MNARGVGKMKSLSPEKPEKFNLSRNCWGGKELRLKDEILSPGKFQ
jgi:hypothetical protein